MWQGKFDALADSPIASSWNLRNRISYHLLPRSELQYAKFKVQVGFEPKNPKKSASAFTCNALATVATMSTWSDKHFQQDLFFTEASMSLTPSGFRPAMAKSLICFPHTHASFLCVFLTHPCIRVILITYATPSIRSLPLCTPYVAPILTSFSPSSINRTDVSLPLLDTRR